MRIASLRRFVIAAGGLVTAATASASPLTIVDTTSTSATADGVVNVGEYVGFTSGINVSFGDQIGLTSQLHVDSDNAGNLNFGLVDGATPLTDFVVIYIDSQSGGFMDTAPFVDASDQHRQAASGTNGADRTDLAFAPGFEADFAIVMNPAFAGLWRLEAGAPHTFIADLGLASGPDWEISLSYADLGLEPGTSFDYVATLLNPVSAYRADEFHGVLAFAAGVIGPGGFATLAPGDFNTFTLAALTPDDLVAGDLVVTEVMQAPAAVGEGAGTWFEVLNTSGQIVDLNGLIVSDDGGESFTVTSTLVVNPGEYIVFGANDDAGLNGGLTVDYDWGSTADFDLNNDADEIVLSNASVVLDRVAYDGTFALADGVSLNLTSVALDATANDFSGNWCSSVDPFGAGDLGTPGAANLECPPDLDIDDDGFELTEDCDDNDPNTFPGAAELDSASLCMTDADGDGYGDAAPAVGVSPGNDCDDSDGAVTLAPTWYLDADVDGYGDPGATTVACAMPGGYVADDTDCDDASDVTFPGAAANDSMTACMTDVDSDGYGDANPASGVTPGSDCDDSDFDVNIAADEVCDGIDNDCSNGIDIAAIDEATWYADADGDGYGDPETTVLACNPPADFVASASDCDDADAVTFPGAAEAESATACMTDADEDGYGDVLGGTPGTDCNDSVAGVNPGATEVCDGIDNDCANGIDVGASDSTTWYADTDGDGFGDAASSQNACDAPADHVSNNNDCDDTDAATFPGAAPNEASPTACMTDADGDDYGDASPAAGIAAGTDCADDVDTVNPGATEVCDGIDNDCTDGIDVGAADAQTWYADADGDSYGDAASSTTACSLPDGHVADATDCDDDDADAYPGAAASDSATACMKDTDGDGWGDANASGAVALGSDCNDAVATVNPDATEVCDGVDNDCDGTADVGAADPATWYADSDGDGYGDATTTTDACDQPADHVADATDCDDTSSVTFPGAAEHDSATACMKDADGDGYGDLAATGSVVAGTDCDDDLDTTNIAGTEVCDSADNDCNGTIDDAAVDATTWYADVDGDGFGDPSTSVSACGQPTDYVADNTDCDDSDPSTYPGIATNETASGVCMTDADGDGFGDASPAAGVTAGTDCVDDVFAVNPGAEEVCDNVDNDCDGTTDVGASDGTTWFADADGDGYGDASSSTTACTIPDGHVADDTDCDDDDADAYPGAAASDSATACMKDADGDGYGDAAATGAVATGSDCNDAVAAVNPDADEVCDDVDNDCDGSTDVGASDATTWYADSDSDGYGDAATTLEACEQPADYVTDATDCDDASAATYPGAAANDDAVACMKDVDGDGYGDAASTGAVVAGTDCDDSAATTNIAGTEVCDTVDNDCNGTADDSAADATTWYADTDSDGYGDASTSVSACAQPVDYVADDTDCDDADAATYPGIATNETERSACMTDADGDGYGDAEPAAGVTAGTDCADDVADVNPGATEVCDSVDNDCDGTTDVGASDATAWYADVDEDGYGDAESSMTACMRPDGMVADDTDCDDASAATFPGAATNEPGAAACRKDVDGDGWGDAAPPMGVAPGTDCDDDAELVFPGATEVCDDVDNDCDGGVDLDATDAVTWYEDADGDGYGDAESSVDACTPPEGFVAGATDCDDADSSVYPEADEIEDGIDNDCDGVVDSPDSDNDGLSDAVEAELMTDPNDPDTDGDGVSDGDEVEAGTNPLVAETDENTMSLGGGADGCSVGASNAGPTGPWMWLFLAGMLVRRRRKVA